MGTSGQSVTLANSIIGVGILAMPFCFQQCGVVLAMLMLLLMGFVSRLSCYFLLKSALISRRWNFEFLAFHIFGPLGKLMVEMGIIGFLMGTCIAYFVVVGDLGPQIIAKMLNINQSDVLRTSVMVVVSLVCVLPLGLLRNVDSLSNVSACTVAFYFCLVMKVLADAAAKILSGDHSINLELWKPAGVLQCVPIFSMALFCQTQLFEIFESLPKLSLEKMNIVTKNAINICTSVYLTLGLFGYIAFSSNEISGNILMSLSETWASDVIKLGFVMSVAFSFPLIIFPCRASLYSLMYRKAQTSHHDHIINHSIPEATFRCITVAIIVITLLISLMIPNIELVLGLVGSTIGVLICVVFPSACFINVIYKNTNEKLLAKIVMMFGLLILVLGTYANLQAAESKLERYDEKYITQEKIDKIVQDFFESKKLQKYEDFAMKPIPNINENINPKDTIIESEVQPPNPVPPESKENKVKQEKIERDAKTSETKQSVDQVKDIEKTKEINLNTVDRSDNRDGLESHPKNVNRKTSNEAKLANGIIQEEKSKVISKVSNNQDKIDMVKQQKLMETIKQHGEEQKELIKEQKVILDELIKTKQELQQNKKEKIDSDDAKKIAVESIQKIANIAIQSLGGVTDKPAQNLNDHEEKVESNLENFANKAVEEIAKKAVETIEAIKDENKNNDHLSLQNNNVPSIQQNLPLNHDQEQNREINKPTKQESTKLEPQLNNFNQQNHKNQNTQNNQVQMAKDPMPQKSVEQSKQNAENIVKEHSHSPDEPKSYIIGEDLQTEQKQKNNPIPISSMPNVPIAMNLNKGLNSAPIVNNIVNENGNKNPSPLVITNNELLQNMNKVNREQNTNDQKDRANEVFNKDNLLQKNILNNLQQSKTENEHDRQKREVVDCTEELLKPEDKQICKTLIVNKQHDVLLPKPDLNDVGIPKSLQLDSNLVYHVRSLKNVEKVEKRR